MKSRLNHRLHGLADSTDWRPPTSKPPAPCQGQQHKSANPTDSGETHPSATPSSVKSKNPCQSVIQTPPGYKRIEAGEIPEEWKAVCIGDIVADFRGGASLKPSDFTQSGVRVLPKGGVARSGKLRIEDAGLQHCSEEYAEAHGSNQVDNSYTIVVLRDLVRDIVKCCGWEPPRRRIQKGCERISYHLMAPTGTSRPDHSGT